MRSAPQRTVGNRNGGGTRVVIHDKYRSRRTVGHLVDSITALTGRADTSSADVVAGVTAVLRAERAEDELAT